MSYPKKKSTDSRPPSPQAVVAEIHEIVYSTQDRLIQEATELVSGQIDDQKAERLSNLGFNTCKDVAVIREKKNKMDRAQKVLMDILYYKDKYPFYKVIDQETIDRICSKYGLVHGEVSDFKGFVPEVKLREIERFRVAMEDKGSKEEQDRRFNRFDGGGWGGSINGISINEIDPAWFIPMSTARSGMGLRAQIAMDSNSPKKSKAPSLRASLEILAPICDMNTQNKRLEGNRLVNHDPIVLQPTKTPGLYFIVTAWGDEASDPEVVNEINN